MEFQRFPGLEINKANTEVEKNLESLNRDGYFIIQSAINLDMVEQLSQAIDKVWDNQLKEFGFDLLEKIGDVGQVRTMMEYDPIFFDLVRHPCIFPYVEYTVGPTSILHLQNGIFLEAKHGHNQGKFHKDFPKDFLSTKVLSVNSLIVIDEFNDMTGGTWVVPGSHLFESMPSFDYIKTHMLQINAKPGDVLFFNSHLWHRGGDNFTEYRRRAINQQYTKPFIKQQINYPALLEKKVNKESLLAQTLGFWSVPPKSVQEYRVSNASLRTYRGGQG